MTTSASSTAIAAGALALLLGAAVPPAAGATHAVESFTFSTAAQAQLTEACGYPVAMSLAGTWNVVAVTGAEGELVKEIRNFRFTADLSAHGVTITGRARGPEILEVHEDGTTTVSVMGVVSRQLPGQGTVMQHAGRMVVQYDAQGEPIGEPVLAGQFDEASEVCQAFEGRPDRP